MDQQGPGAQPRPQTLEPSVLAMDYVLAMLLPQGMPWSEEEDEVPFFTWFDRVFSERDSIELWKFLGRDALGLLQQEEYVTAFPKKPGSHPLIKHQNGFDAELKPPDMDSYHPGNCVKLILRNVRTCRNDTSEIFPTWQDPDKFWCAFKTKWLTTGLSAPRSSMMRSHPGTLHEVLAQDHIVLTRLLKIVEANLGQLQDELVATAGVKRKFRNKKRERCKNLICMQKMLTWREYLQRERKKSTLWNPIDPDVHLISPEDIGRSQCSCARHVKFSQHISENCPGGFLAFAPTTYFKKVEHVIPALLHASKARLLSFLRACPVYYDSILRVTADTDAPEYLRVVATYSNFVTSHHAGQRSTESDEHGTDKHRIIWLVPLSEMREFIDGTSLGNTSLWEKGALHLILSAPKGNNFSWRMTIAPAAEEGGEYYGIVLDWCGDQLFQHAALLKAMESNEEDVLGVITPLFKILEPLSEPHRRLGRENVFFGMFTDDLLNDLEKKRCVKLSPDQRRVLQNISKSRSGVQTIAARAGTGKTKLAGILLEALMDLIKNMKLSVVILTPSRYLRDELMTSEDCVGPFAAEGKVLWLGRPAPGNNSSCLWESHIAEQVEEILRYQKGKLQKIENTMKQHHQGLMKIKLNWKKILYCGDNGWHLYWAVAHTEFCRVLASFKHAAQSHICLLYTSPSPRDRQKSRMPSSA